LSKGYFLIVVIIGLLLFSLVGCGKTPDGQGQLNKPPKLMDINNRENIENTSANLSPEMTIFEKDKVKVDWKETVVINDCVVKNGPGEDYSNIGNLKYGDTILLKGSYNGWFLAGTDNIIEFWVESKNVADYDFNSVNSLFGVVTAENVNLGRIIFNKGNLIWILKKDADRAYVRPVAIDISDGYSGWINNTDFTMNKQNVYFNQAFLKKDAKVYKESNEKSELNSDFNLLSGSGGYIFIHKVQDDGWVHISAFGGIDGWVKNTDIYLP